MLCIVVLALMARFVGRGFGSGEPVWNLSQHGWQPWAVVMLACLIPLLTTSLGTMWLSQGMRRSRLRQVALALLWPLGSVTIGSVSRDPLAVFDVPVWWSAPPLQVLLTVYSMALATGLVAWAVAWLILTVAEWHPPANLVRRPLPQR